MAGLRSVAVSASFAGGDIVSGLGGQHELRCLTSSELETYLARLDLKHPLVKSRELLFEFHRKHLTKIAWQTFDLFMGRSHSVSVEESLTRIGRGRGGYCFHLNLAFGCLLKTVGFEVRFHIASVQRRSQPAPMPGGHFGLSVLIDDIVYLVDVGLGDIFMTPVPLAPATHRESPFEFHLDCSDVPSTWRLTHDTLGAFVQVEYDTASNYSVEAVQEQHARNCCPDSPYCQRPVFRMREADVVHELKGVLWSIISANRSVQRTAIQDVDLWCRVVRDIFKDSLEGYSHRELEDAWPRIVSASSSVAITQADGLSE